MDTGNCRMNIYGSIFEVSKMQNKIELGLKAPTHIYIFLFSIRNINCFFAGTVQSCSSDVC